MRPAEFDSFHGVNKTQNVPSMPTVWSHGTSSMTPVSSISWDEFESHSSWTQIWKWWFWREDENGRGKWELILASCSTCCLC